MKATASGRIDALLVEVATREIDAAVGDIFAALAILGAAFATTWLSAWRERRRFETTDLTGLQSHIFSALDTQPLFDSAGFVLETGTLVDRRDHLDWWHRGDGGAHEFVVLNLEPDAPDRYEYTTMDWFVAARDERRRSVAGPLIDLPCADEYVMTCAWPVVVDDRFLGVAAADVSVAGFEGRVVPALRRLPAAAVLANHENRVIASNDGRFATGEKLPRTPPLAHTWWHVEPVTDDLGWTLVAAER